MAVDLAERKPGIEEITSWDIIIRPQRAWFRIPVKDLWNARELIGIFVWRDFVATYKQTALGTAWYIIQPILTSLTYLVIFKMLVGLSTANLPPFLFYLSGTVVWSYFSSNFIKTSGTFLGSAHLFQKVYFPRLAVPVSIILSNLIGFGIQFGTLVLFLVAFQLKGVSLKPNMTLFLLPVLLVMMAGLGLGFGLIISALSTRYRDFHHLVTFANQVLLFATPVIYPASVIPMEHRWVIWLNPISSIVETFRFSLLGAGFMPWGQLLYSFLFTIGILFFGLLLFHRVESTFVDTL